MKLAPSKPSHCRSSSASISPSMAPSRGDFEPISGCPASMILSARFDVSRPILREALKRLRDAGVIASRQGSGHFVRMQIDQRNLGFSPVETIADIQRCYEFRLTIEGDAAYFAARRRNGEAMGKISAALELLSDATRRHAHREDADYAFHCAVAEASNNHYYASSMLALKDHIAVGMKLHGLSLMGASPSLARVLEHRGIFGAIEQGDSDMARDLMRQHLQMFDRLFEGHICWTSDLAGIARRALPTDLDQLAGPRRWRVRLPANQAIL